MSSSLKGRHNFVNLVEPVDPVLAGNLGRVDWCLYCGVLRNGSSTVRGREVVPVTYQVPRQGGPEDLSEGEFAARKCGGLE